MTNGSFLFKDSTYSISVALGGEETEWPFRLAKKKFNTQVSSSEEGGLMIDFSGHSMRRG